jgi:hypothetical protein
MAEISADISAKKRPFWIEPLTAYSRVLFRLINAIRNVDCSGGSCHDPGSSIGRSLLSESVCSLSARVVYGTMKAFPIMKSTITSCDILSARPLRHSDAFQVSKIIGPASEGNSSFDTILNLGQAVTGAFASIACPDHSHTPGRSEYSTGIHAQLGLYPQTQSKSVLAFPMNL